MNCVKGVSEIHKDDPNDFTFLKSLHQHVASSVESCQYWTSQDRTFFLSYGLISHVQIFYRNDGAGILGGNFEDYLQLSLVSQQL